MQSYALKIYFHLLLLQLVQQIEDNVGRLPKSLRIKHHTCYQKSNSLSLRKVNRLDGLRVENILLYISEWFHESSRDSLTSKPQTYLEANKLVKIIFQSRIIKQSEMVIWERLTSLISAKVNSLSNELEFFQSIKMKAWSWWQFI